MRTSAKSAYTTSAPSFRAWTRSRGTARMGFFDKLKQGLAKTKQLLQTDVRDLLKAGEILDEPKLVEFEKRLLRTDMGVVAADAILAELRSKHLGRTVVLDEIWTTIKDKLKSLLRGDGNSNWNV